MKTYLYKQLLSLLPRAGLVGGSTRAWNMTTPEGVSAFRLLLLTARSFVFSDELLKAFGERPPNTRLKKAERFELDIPFQGVFLEGVERSIFALKDPSGGSDRQFYGIGVFEHENSYYFIAMVMAAFEAGTLRVVVDSVNREQWEQGFVADDRTDGVGPVLHSIVAELFAFLREQKAVTGTQKINERVRVGEGKDRTLVKIKEIVHVCLKSQQKAYASNSLPIDWSHRWEVSGHWRSVTGVGKNRQGEYCVKGLTWVLPFVKGPESKPLIKKLRVFQDESDSENTQ